MKAKSFVNAVFLLASLFFLLNPDVSGQKTDYTKYVDPYIGTGGHGHVFLGANVPFGAVQVGPTNYVKGWDWCSGYHYSDSIVTGFSQLHLSGTGIGDLGDVLISPYTGELKSSPGTIDHPFSGYASKYSHHDEIARAGYYSVLLKNYEVRVELTCTERVAFHQYTFPAAQQAHIAINLEEGIGWDQPVETSFKKVDDTTFVGYRFSTGWAKDQRLYFAIRLSKPVGDIHLFDGGKSINGDFATGKKITGVLNFSTSSGEKILLKVGISPVSEENALNNIRAEIPGWNFNGVVQKAHEAWNAEIGKVKANSKNTADLRTFYTALYHSYTTPILFNDHNGDYRGADKMVHHGVGFQNYSVFSLWDTYRAAHPLYTLVQPERVSDFVNSMLAIYQQQGKLPIWHLMGNETDCMVGYSAVPVIADAYFKGFTGFDPKLALQAMKASSTRDDYGMKYVKQKGYIPADLEPESVAKALEYSISDWCIAQMARKMGQTTDYANYAKRASSYVRYFDPKTKFMRAKLDNGKFREPFNPFEPSIMISGKEWKDYTEGNGWQYTWLVPQDVEGLIRLFGGEKPFVAKLDSLFVVKGELGTNAPPDISGLIGQYAHGNEPSHHVAYLYPYAGRQWKTAEIVRKILYGLYSDKTDGLCGNDDCGQMSAWYILSAIGFYPVNPANTAFVFGSPIFDEVTLQFPQRKLFTIKTVNNSKKNIYIQSVRLNGKPFTRSYITYSELRKGGLLEFTMGPRPNRNFGSALKDRPKSEIFEKQ
ncbi:MAG: GH92 family glycosyl hydrolase [Bacteroidota bacterium]|nr:GH92 family glycosyl hydrolase [Bacteroidota bacterium]